MELFPVMRIEKFTVGQRKLVFNMLLLEVILKKRKSNRFIFGWYPCKLLKRENGRNIDGIRWIKSEVRSQKAKTDYV